MDFDSGSIDRLGLMLETKKFGSVGVISPVPNAGVTTLSQKLGAQQALAGYRTLLIQVAEISGGGSEVASSSQQLLSDLRGFDRYLLELDRDRPIWTASRVSVQDALHGWLQRYQRIILDLPPLTRATHVSSLPMASGCDCVILVCPLGISSRRVESALDALVEDSVNVAAVAWIDLNGVSSTSQLKQFAKRWGFSSDSSSPKGW